MKAISRLGQCRRDSSDAIWLWDAIHDLSYALRKFRRSPGFALATILTLALGIGANTTVFSIADAVLLKMLPVREPERLIQILQPMAPPSRSTGSREASGYLDQFSFANYKDMQQVAAPVEDVVAESRPYTTQAALGSAEETIRYAAVSGNYFNVLGVRAVVGQVFQSAIDSEIGQHPEAIISYGFWKRRFGLDSRVIGRAIRIRDTPFQITGVSEPGFFGLQVGSMTDVWTPMIMETARLRRSVFLRLVARPHRGVTAPQALAQLQVWYHRSVMDRLGSAPPSSSLPRFARESQLKTVPAAKGMSPLREKYGEPIEIVFAVVAIVLLLACANVANLLLAGASARQREMAVRKSLGAGRIRLVRQLLTESLLLTLAAAAAGALAANWSTPALVALLAPSDTPVQLAVGLNARVLVFTAVVSLLTAIGSGVFPALRASDVDIHAALKSGTRLAGSSRAWQSRLLVALQMALSLVLLVTSALFVRTLMNLKALDPGFDRRNVVVAGVSFRSREKDDRISFAWQELLGRIRAIPGVESASVSIGGPFLGARRAGETRVANTPWDDSLPFSWTIPVSTNYFRTFGAPVNGRDFAPRDLEPSAPAVGIINETMAHRFFGNDDPIGRRLNDFGSDPPQGAETIEIVGVATDMKYDSLRTGPPPIVYLPFPQHGSSLKLPLDAMDLQLRTRLDTGSLARILRRELAGANPGFALLNITSQNKLVDDALLRERLLATVGSFFGVLALLLAGIGLHGTMSYSVSRRTQEMGIRMALGARPHQVLRMVMSEALVTVGAGGVVGIAAAILVARIVESLLFGLKPQDLSTIALAAGLLAAISLVAAFVPALRACRIDPMEALRNE